MEVTVRQEGMAVVLDITGQITFDNSEALRSEIQGALTQAKTALILNLKETTYVDSSGIAALIEGLKASQSEGKAFGLCEVSASVLNVLQLVRLDKILNLFPNEARALEQLACPLDAKEGGES